MRRHSCFLAALIACFLWPLAAAAQIDGEQERIAGWNAQLSEVEATLERDDLTNAEFNGLLRSARSVLDEARAFDQALEPRIAQVRDQLASVAPVEGVDAGEVPALVEARARLQAELDRLIALQQQATLVALNADQLIDRIAAARDAEFATFLFSRDRSALSPSLLADLATELPRLALGTWQIVGDWGRLLATRSDLVTLALVGLSLLIVILAMVGRARFLRWAEGGGDTREPTRSERYVMAAAVAAVDIGVPLLILLGLRAVLAELGLLPRGVRDIYYGVMVAVAVFTGITGLARGLAAPTRPAWRIAGIADQTAIGTYSIVVAAAAILALNALIAELATATASPADFATGLGGVLAVPTAILALMATRVLVQGRDALSTEERLRSSRWRILTPFAALAAIVTIAAAVAGYLAFAGFMISQIAWVWVIVGVWVLASGLIEVAFQATMKAETPVGQRLARNLGIGNRAFNQLGVVLLGIVKLMLALLAVLLIVAPWGFDSASIATRVEGLYYGVRIGTIRITFSTIVTTLVIFVVVVAVTRIFRNWLDRQYLPTTSIEPGLQNSVRVIVGYAGMILAVVLAASYAGFDLASIAIVAGALSVGIGFGLQSIVNNFVSGLILLAERPIRAGDWIEVGTQQGTVRRISVRATEVETFDRASVIIPNSDLISGVVTNRYLRGNIGRVAIPVGVSYAADPARVKEVLLACAAGHPLVLKEPPPFVLFMDFGASSLDFELRCFLTDISNGLTVRSDLRFAILAALREAGIEIPFPQQDIHFRDLPEIRDALAQTAAGKRSNDNGG